MLDLANLVAPGSPRFAVYVEAWEATTAEHGWTQETQRQWDVTMDLWKAMVRIYRKHLIDCMVDIYAPPCPPEPGDTSMTDFDIRQVVLLPSLEVSLERNRVRNRQPLLRDDDLRGNYEDFAWCVERFQTAHVIDNSVLTVDDTVAAIDTVLADRWVTPAGGESATAP